MSTSERLVKLGMADAATLARVDAVLDHKDGATHTPNKDTRLLTFTETAKMLKLSRPSVYRLTKCGRLKVVPLCGVNRIMAQSVYDFLNGKGV